MAEHSWTWESMPLFRVEGSYLKASFRPVWPVPPEGAAPDAEPSNFPDAEISIPFPNEAYAAEIVKGLWYAVGSNTKADWRIKAQLDEGDYPNLQDLLRFLAAFLPTQF